MSLASEQRSLARAKAHSAIDAASLDLESGAIDEVAWQRRVTDALAAAYLLDDDPRWQSGFDGDAELWCQARELILDAVDRDGTFLDVGCATGHLMESLATWARERGFTLFMYGLELSPALASAARQRLPAWADRIFIGNAVTWDPPRKFRYVRTGLEYVAPGRASVLIARLLRDVVAPGGRLIVGPVSAQDLQATVAAFAEAGIARPEVREATDRNRKTRYVVWTASR